MRPGVDAVPDGSLSRAARVLDLGAADVLVVFDFRRYEEETVNFGRRAAKQGATLILITDQWLSPLASDAAVTLPCPVESTVPFDSLTPAMAVTEALIAALAAALGTALRFRASATAAITRMYLFMGILWGLMLRVRNRGCCGPSIIADRVRRD
jgi:DNA-binding MurR/RpiR family transcriptional regulator